MISKKEFFEICPTATEADWNAFCNQMSAISDKMWDEDHPMDE